MKRKLTLILPLLLTANTKSYNSRDHGKLDKAHFIGRSIIFLFLLILAITPFNSAFAVTACTGNPQVNSSLGNIKVVFDGTENCKYSANRLPLPDSNYEQWNIGADKYRYESAPYGTIYSHLLNAATSPAISIDGATATSYPYSPLSGRFRMTTDTTYDITATRTYGGVPYTATVSYIWNSDNTITASGATVHIADTTAPTVSSFTSTTTNGSFKQDDTINITANTSENIVSGNTLTVTLDTGETVLLTAASNGTTLVGTYTVGAGDTSSDLTVSSFVIGTVADSAGNPMTSTTVPTGSNNIAGSKALVVDTTSPIITSNSGGATASVSIAENTTAVTTIVATDTNTRTYSISGGADQAKFSISSAALSFATAPNFESPADTGANNTYIVEVTATDAAGNTDTQTITVTVTNVNEGAIAISDQTRSIAENSANATNVGEVLVTTGSPTGFSITSGNTNTAFAISSTGQITVADVGELDFETTPSYTLAVQITKADTTSQSANITINVTNVNEGSAILPTPLAKKDVTASVEAWNGATSKWAGNVMGSISDRLNWLSRNKDTTQTSYQGIKIHFENEVIEAVMNATPRSKAAIVADIKNIDVTNKAIALLQNTQGALVATGKGIQSDAQAIALNEAARFRNDIIGTLNPSFGTVVDDWSVWTSGEVSIGETKASATSSKQESNSKILSLGFDKKTNTNNLTGFVLSIGQDDIDIGTSTTNVKSDNYNLSSYGVFKQQNGTIVEAIFGLGHLKFDTIRKDGSDTLTGKRNANQLFASATLRDKIIEHNNWSISPYGKLTLAHTKLKKFSEAGGSTALTFNEQSVNDARVFVGADANYLITINNGTIKPFAKLEYGHDVSSSSDATMHYNTETTNYTLTVDKQAKSNWKMDVGADLFTKDGWNSSISYRREQAINSGHSDGLSFDVGLRF